MTYPPFDIRIHSAPDEVAPFVAEAQQSSDANKDALGFLPEGAYKEAADQGKLLIAVVQDEQGSVYAGHLLHGGVFPQAKIFQVYTVPMFRNHGIGRRLVEAIVRRAESMQFMSVLAKVADDLTANTFWKRLGFEVIRTKPGGRTTGRQINIRIRELSTPHLFSFTSGPIESSAKDLKLISRFSDISPIYVLDVNILFDLLKRRANENEVGRIIRASFSNVVRLAIAEEFVKELERTSNPTPADPILELARRLPRLQTPTPGVDNKIIAELGGILFPDEISRGSLRPQDQSDLIHLATAIHHKASGFITGERAILRGRAALQARYGLDVVGANEFADTVEPSDNSESPGVKALSAGQVLEERPIQHDNRSLVESFLARMRCPSQLGQDALRTDPGRPHRRIVVTCEGTVVAVGSWEAPSGVRHQVQAFLCVDEDHSAVTLAADFVLDKISRESLSDSPTQLSLRLLPGHVTTRRIAIGHGFRPPANEPPNSTNLQKIALGRCVTARNWDCICQQLKKDMGLELPASIFSYESLVQPVLVKGQTGQEVSIPLEEIEALLSPAIFFLPGRSGAIVPIRSVYSADLIGGAKQASLLASPEAVLLRERVYFSSPRTASVLTRGTPILFYESGYRGGSKSVTATARVVRTEVVSKEGADQELLRRGVLAKNNLKTICLSDTVLATTIDNIMPFRNPVKLERLRSLGAVDGANLRTARPLEAKKVIQIIEEGML